MPLALHDGGRGLRGVVQLQVPERRPRRDRRLLRARAPHAGAVAHAHSGALPGARLAGWWGHEADTRFLMEPQFRAAGGAAAWQISNPPILVGRAAARLARDVHRGGHAAAAREIGGAHRLPGRAAAAACAPAGAASSRRADRAQRGCQLSLRIARRRARAAARVFEALRRAAWSCDWRAPDIIRVAPVPLYNRFEDVCASRRRWREVLRETRVKRAAARERQHRRRRTGRRAARGAARAPRPAASTLLRAPPRSAPGAARARPLDQSGARRARHARARARRRHGAHAAAADPDARPHGARAVRARPRCSPTGSASTRSSTRSAARELNRVLIEEAARHPRRRACTSTSSAWARIRRANALRLRDQRTRRRAYEVALDAHHRHRRRRLGGARQPRRRGPRERARGMARPRLQGTDHAGRRRPARARARRAAHLAARRLHADRAAQHRRQLHRDAVPAAQRCAELRRARQRRGGATQFFAREFPDALPLLPDLRGAVRRAPAGTARHRAHRALARRRRRCCCSAMRRTPSCPFTARA